MGYRIQTSAVGEEIYLEGLLPPGGTVTIELRNPANDSVVPLSSTACVESPGHPGKYRWHTSAITTPATAYTQYSCRMTNADTNEFTDMQLIVGGYPNKIDAAVSSRSSHGDPDPSGYLDAAISDVKAKTDNLPPDPASETNVNTNETKIDALQNDVTAIKGQTDNLPADTSLQLKIIQALCGKNNKLYNPTYDSYGNLTGGTLRGYASKADLEADQNHIFELTLSGTYSGFGKVTEHTRKDSA